MIKPSECLTVQDKEKLKHLEIAVDHYLRHNYDGHKRLLLSNVIQLAEGKIRNALFEMYRANGWDVWFESHEFGGASGPYFIEQGKREIERGVQRGDR